MGKNKNDSADEYLDRVIKRLENEYFDIKSNIKYKNQNFKYIAKRKRFEVDKFNFIFTFFMFSKFSSLDIKTLEGFSAESYKYAVGSIAKPLPHGLFWGKICYPVAVVDKIDYLTSKFIRKKAPPKHLLGLEMPVIYSLESGELHYCEMTPFYGWVYYDEMRYTINYMLSP